VSLSFCSNCFSLFLFPSDLSLSVSLPPVISFLLQVLFSSLSLDISLFNSCLSSALPLFSFFFFLSHSFYLCPPLIYSYVCMYFYPFLPFLDVKKKFKNFRFFSIRVSPSAASAVLSKREPELRTVRTRVTGLGEFSRIGWFFSLGQFFNYKSSLNLSHFFPRCDSYALILAKKWVGLHFGRFFSHQLIWSPCFWRTWLDPRSIKTFRLTTLWLTTFWYSNRERGSIYLEIKLAPGGKILFSNFILKCQGVRF
jgi:hypothetical protein